MDKNLRIGLGIAAFKITCMGIGAAVLILLTGCGDAITSSARQDWRTIHQPAPTTPGGGD